MHEMDFWLELVILLYPPDLNSTWYFIFCRCGVHRETQNFLRANLSKFVLNLKFTGNWKLLAFNAIIDRYEFSQRFGIFILCRKLCLHVNHRHSSYFGFEMRFSECTDINDKCRLFTVPFSIQKTIRFLLNKHKKCSSHLNYSQLFDTFSKIFHILHKPKIFEMQFNPNGFDTPLLRHHIAWMALP